jgi:hypothetical protein
VPAVSTSVESMEQMGMLREGSICIFALSGSSCTWGTHLWEERKACRELRAESSWDGCG